MSSTIDFLLIDDDPGDVVLALSVLRALKIADRCIAVSDGEAGMDFLLGRNEFSKRPRMLPRLVLLDLKMPRMNGFDFLQKARSTEGLRLVPIVALTSSREESDVERAYDLGANAYVVKSINFFEYRETLESVVRYWGDVNVGPQGLIKRSFVVPRKVRGNQSVRNGNRYANNPWLWTLALC
jgi:CheY-like chemotaxis protein